MSERTANVKDRGRLAADRQAADQDSAQQYAAQEGATNQDFDQQDFDQNGSDRQVKVRRVLKFRHVNAQTSRFEIAIQARMTKLAELVDGFTNSTSHLLVSQDTPAREILEELVVKESALRWIARVASHSTDPIREKLWLDIDAALTDLEHLASAYDHIQRLILDGSLALESNSRPTGRLTA